RTERRVVATAVVAQVDHDAINIVGLRALANLSDRLRRAALHRVELYEQRLGVIEERPPERLVLVAQPGRIRRSKAVGQPVIPRCIDRWADRVDRYLARDALASNHREPRRTSLV